ncbi:MAG: ABC transporter permease subunit [Anaerolineales bacterium]|nr:ABC transporter permease subunit [Anaerolineales bacterium]
MKGAFEFLKKVGFITLSLVVGLILWQAFTAYSDIPSFIFPTPLDVWKKFLSVFLDGSLLFHTLVTLREVLLGLTLGLSVATLTGYFLAKSRTVERVLSPYIVASQSIPIVAIAPLLVIWLGPGIFSKILTSALIVFFPVLVNTIVGIRSVPGELYELMKSLQANHWQRIIKLEIPAALPVFLGGLRIGATLAVIGAVVGEFVGADKGLGFLVNVGRGLYDTSLVFVAVFTLVILALGLYGSVVFLESRLLSWKKRE